MRRDSWQGADEPMDGRAAPILARRPGRFQSRPTYRILLSGRTIIHQMGSIMARREGEGRGGPRRAGILLALGLLLALSACGDRTPPRTPDVLRTLPHDPGAYTQGLLLHEGRFYESTGRYGESTLREVEVETGRVLRSVELPEEYFGEGLALVDDRLIQLTWKEEVAFVYDLETFEEIDRFSYETEGWGLCYDGEWLYMTTGGTMLYRRDPESFEAVDRVQIARRGQPVWRANELACVGDYVFANVFMTDRILQIDKRSGEVVREFDGSELIPEGGRPANAEAVLNGIAHDPSSGTFYLTGKLWPTMFEVRLPGV